MIAVYFFCVIREHGIVPFDQWFARIYERAITGLIARRYRVIPNHHSIARSDILQHGEPADKFRRP